MPLCKLVHDPVNYAYHTPNWQCLAPSYSQTYGSG